MLTALIVVVAGLVAAPYPWTEEARADDVGVSGAFALGGGLSGSVDPRTGQFSVSVPLVNVAGRGDAGINISLSWEQARASAGLDRAGWGGGWSLGMTFIETEGEVTVYPANGGSYVADASYDSGLRYYLLSDIAFETSGGTRPGRNVPGGTDIEDQDYSYTITYTDGKVDYYDGDGNLIARMDRFDNRTDLAYTSPAVDEFQLTTIVDSYGLVTTLGYDEGSFVVAAPERSDGVVPTTTVDFDNAGDIATITDPNGATTDFGYTDLQVGDGTQHLLSTATGPAGATSTVGYDTVSYPGAPPLVIAETLDVADVDGKAMTPTRTFDMDPTPANGSHNYVGYPDYLSTDGTDQLFEQADPNYTYTTKLSTPAAATLSTYDAAHRLITREVQGAANNGDLVTASTQGAEYPDLMPVGFQPKNYHRPTTSTVTHSARGGPNGLVAVAGDGRTVTTTTSYDDWGRILQLVDEVGTTTEYTYDEEFGLVTSTAVTGSDGTTRTTTNTLTDDSRSFRTSTVVEGTTAATASARTVTTYEFDQYGEPQSRKVAWAAGAAPADDGGGPASSTTLYSTVVDPAAATRELTITQASGTDAESSTTTTLDLVTGKAVAFADELDRVTTTGYDAGGRVTSVTGPDGLTTKTAYTPADGASPATMLHTAPDGHQTLTTYDGLGRTVKVTDNVKNGAFVSSPTTRTVATHVYSDNKVTQGGGAAGTTLTSTDLAGRVTTTVTDGLGRTVLEALPNGVSHTTAYDDVANTVTQQTIGYGASSASEVGKVGYDALNRVVSSRTTYPDGPRTSLVDPVHQVVWDGIGRQTSVTDQDLVTTPGYAGAGGVPSTFSIAPAKTARAPGLATTATDTTMLDGSTTHRVLQQDGQAPRSGTKIAYDAAGRITTATDPLGRATAYTYYDDGQVDTVTSPSGIVTKTIYDPAGRVDTATSTDTDGNKTSVKYTYVPAGRPGAGQVATVADASGTISYGYDADGHRTKVSYPDGSATSNTYGDNGLLATSTDVTGATTAYAYNPTDGSIKSATQSRGGTTLASVSYTYDELGRQQTIKRGNGLVTTNTYTPHSMLATQTTVDAKGNAVESHSYGYDSHHNLSTKTSTTAKPSRCTANCAAGPSTYGTYTTTYSYDIYDQLIGSAVYAGGKATGTALTTNDYVLDVSGNVTTNTLTTTSTGAKPTTTKKVTVNTLDDAGQLTGQTVGSAAQVEQAYNDDGHVTAALNGATTTYRPDGLVASVTQEGATTTFDYWADGTRKRSTTTDPVNGTTATEFHYSPAGTLVNDTTTLSGTGAQDGSATASYLLTHGREARTLQPGTTAAGKIIAGKKAAGKKGRARAAVPAPVTIGAGVGYLLRDRHSSVTALVDSAGTVTNTYAYTDYGAPALHDGSPGTLVGAAPGAAAGTSNPQRYTGAATKALYTDAALGTMMTPARFYDPSQGRFTARDTANVHNRYVGFATNPIMNVDPTGQSPLADFFIDAIYIVVFFAATVATGGAAAAAVGPVFALQAIATVANLVGLAANATRFVDDVSNATTGRHFLSDDQRSDLNNVATVAGAVAGVAGMVAAGAEATASVAREGEKAVVRAARDPVAKPTPDELARNLNLSPNGSVDDLKATVSKTGTRPNDPVPDASFTRPRSSSLGGFVKDYSPVKPLTLKTPVDPGALNLERGAAPTNARIELSDFTSAGDKITRQSKQVGAAIQQIFKNDAKAAESSVRAETTTAKTGTPKLDSVPRRGGVRPRYQFKLREEDISSPAKLPYFITPG